MTMRIGMVYQAQYPPAERIEKIAKTLAAAGHHVHLLCNSYAPSYRRAEVIDRLGIHRVGPALPSEVISRIIKFPLFANPIWLTQLIRFVHRFRLEAIHVIDLPLAPAAWVVARAFGIPVVMDMWENYPEALKGWAKDNWKTRWFKNPAMARAVERWIVPRMDHVIVVVEEQRDRLIADGVDASRISVITNAVDPELFSNPIPAKVTPLDEAGTYKLVYVGFITVERGLEDIVRAIALLRSRMPFIRFYIAGSGPHEPQIRNLIAQEGVEGLVELVGFVPFNEIRLYLEKSDLCLIPHVNNAFINTTMPNKLFQYMFMGKPVLVSDARPLARIVRESGSGFVFESGNPASAAASIEAAYAARDDLSIGERGRRHVHEHYTWDKVAPVLNHIYDDHAAFGGTFAPAQD
jgi:glycosyltransferase involved in cell wall biosynthesis